MWTSTLDLDPARVVLTQLLGRFWRGAYFTSFAPFRVQNLPRQPLPAPDWVRVRNRLAGICGSDLHLISTDGDFRIAPAAVPGNRHAYPGHEVVGEVIEVGDEVQELSVGDTVVFQSGPNCITAGVQPPCRSCASGNYSLCEQGYLPGPPPVGGGWSEEMLLHEQQLFRVPDAFNKPGERQLDDEQAVLLEPASVAVHAVLRHVPLPGDRVLIIGAGTIGLLTLQAVRALAPDAEVSVLARHAFQVEQATRMGATHIIYPQDSYKEIQQVTGAHLYSGLLGNKMLLGGFDVIYDTVGSKRTVHNALRWARARSTVVLVGLSLHLMKIDLSPIWYQEVNLIGTLAHGMEHWPPDSQSRRSTFAITADLIEQSLLHPEQLITHRFALNDYRQALLAALHKKHSRAIKIIFDYALQPASVVPNVRAARQRRPLPAPRQAALPAPIEFPSSAQHIVEPDQTPAPVERAFKHNDDTTMRRPPSIPNNRPAPDEATEKQEAVANNHQPTEPTEGPPSVTNAHPQALQSVGEAAEVDREQENTSESNR